MKFNKNAVGREIPEYLEGIGELVPFKAEDAIQPTKPKTGAKLRMRIQDEPKIVASIEEAIKKSGLKDRITISFHRHMRKGDTGKNTEKAEICLKFSLKKQVNRNNSRIKS